MEVVDGFDDGIRVSKHTDVLVAKRGWGGGVKLENL